MEYHEGQLCISLRELEDGGVMTQAYCRQLASRKKVELARRGGRQGCALVVMGSLPEPYLEKIKALSPDPSMEVLYAWLDANYEVDPVAVDYFTDWKVRHNSEHVKDEHIREYVTNASVLNACIRLYNNAKAIHKTMGMKYDWSMMSKAVEGYRVKTGHTLPSSTLRFRKKVNEYQREGYVCLISGKFGNQSSRKVSVKVERLVVAIAQLPNKPWNTSVWEMYNMFVCGELDVWDPKTGELFNPEEYTDKNGEPLSLSESTIANILNSPKNRVLIDKEHMSYSTFMHEVMPHMHRHAPEYSFSKISFDDRDLPRKLRDTKARPKAYYAYDVASQCVVGFAYNRKKNVELVKECFLSMFRLIARRGWGCPAQVEVENHLMSQWKDSFLKDGELFPHVHFCAPMNSQEKYAEQLNGAKKRSIEHKNHLGIGRFYAKGRAYRTESKKVFDELNDTYEDKQYYSWEELITEDARDVMEFNNSLHPNQKKYPGMTRWQVLEENMNPNLRPMNMAEWARFIGDHAETSVRRNSYCRVGYKDWWLSDTKAIERLAPNNYKVDAYSLTDDEGNVTDVYIYQNGKLIDKLEDVGTFNTADAEQTDEDRAIFVEQRKKIAQFNRYVEEHKVETVGVQKMSGCDGIVAYGTAAIGAEAMHIEQTVEALELPTPSEEPEEVVTYQTAEPIADF